VIKALLWKELRENWPRALFGLLGLTAGMTLMFGSIDGAWRGEAPLAAPPTQMITIVGFAIVGLVLGLLQVIPELWRKQWAFLIQRPVTRTTVFWGKVGAGLSLYALATGLPLLVAALWAATPGNVAAPFSIEMLGPGVVDLLAGVSYYFAGLTIGMREARWYGSRVLPLGLAIATSVASAAFPVFAGALFIALAGAAVLGVAAWGTIVSGGTYASAPRPAKACLSVSVATGALLALWLASWLVGVVAAADTPDGKYVEYRVATSGDALRVTYASWRRDEVESIQDLDGNELDKTRYVDPETKDLAQAKMLAFHYHYIDDGSRDLDHYRQPSRFLALRGNGNPSTAWFFDTEERFIVGYDWQRKVPLGTVGVHGFTPHGQGTAAPFDEGLARPHHRWSLDDRLLVLKSKAYRLDLKGRRAPRLVFQTPEGEQIRWATLRLQGPDLTEAYSVATNLGVHLIENGGRSLRVAYPAPNPKRGTLQLATNEKGDHFLWQSRKWMGESQLTRVSGGVVRETTSLPPATLQEKSDPAVGWALYGAPAAPTGVLALAAFVATVDPSGGWSVSQFSSSFNVVPGFLYLFVGVTLLSALLCSIVSWRLARQHAFTRARALGWSVFSFVFGPAGLLGFLFVQDWPARQACSCCKRQRVVDRLSCEHCEAGWPAPKRDGSEIFERALPEHELLLHA